MGDPRVLLGDSRVLLGDPRVLLGDSRVFLGDPRVLLGEPLLLFKDSAWSSTNSVCNTEIKDQSHFILSQFITPSNTLPSPTAKVFFTIFKPVYNLKELILLIRAGQKFHYFFNPVLIQMSQ